MNPKASRNLLYVILLVVAAIAAMCSSRDSKLVAADSRLLSTGGGTKALSVRASGGVASGTVSVLASTTERQRALGAGRGGTNPLSPNYGAALFNQNARTLITSSELAKVDYGMLRSRALCVSFSLENDPTKTVREFGYSLSTFKGAEGALLIGNADEQVRSAAFSRSFERCRVLLEPGLSDKEYADLAKLPLPAQARAITRQLGSMTASFDEPYMNTVLTQAVNGPMYGALALLMVRKLDYGDLETSYSQDQISALSSLVVDLVLCRMGDDCAGGGFLNTQLCWQNGICGDNTEEAIWANLRDRGLDTTALNLFVTRVHQALQAGDTSIFRKAKPGK